MLRSVCSVLAAGVLAISAAACSANGQSSCTQPPVQHYPAPQMVLPSSGSGNYPDNAGVIQVSTQTQVIVGALTLRSSSGAILSTGTATLAPTQPDPNAFLWNVKIPRLAAATVYALVWTVQYPAGCLAPTITNTQTLGTFKSQ
jgi:hypothetical protein